MQTHAEMANATVKWYTELVCKGLPKDSGLEPNGLVCRVIDRSRRFRRNAEHAPHAQNAIYLRGQIYPFCKQINGRRSVVSLETHDLRGSGPTRARNSEAAGAATSSGAHGGNRAESKASVLKMFVESVKNIPM